MATLLLRLDAPLQSWGVDSKFDIRQTGHEPSKSGVIGMLAAALGRGRGTSVADLAALRFGIRVLKEGNILCDYHTVSRNPDPRPAQNKTDYVTKRYYLADAAFLAGLEGEDATFLWELDAAVKMPAFPLFLGRRSCPPTPPVSLGVHNASLEEALLHPACPEAGAWRGPKPARLVLEVKGGNRSAVLLRDQPVSFSQRKRVHGFRLAAERFVQVEAKEVDGATVPHDALQGLLEVEECT